MKIKLPTTFLAFILSIITISIITAQANPHKHKKNDNYIKDNWNVYFQGHKIDDASVSSFIDLGDGYGKDKWNVYYRGQIINDASASSFECIGKGYGKDNWNTYYCGKKRDHSACSSTCNTKPSRNGYFKDSWKVYYL